MHSYQLVTSVPFLISVPVTSSFPISTSCPCDFVTSTLGVPVTLKKIFVPVTGFPIFYPSCLLQRIVSQKSGVMRRFGVLKDDKKSINDDHWIV